jgi:NTP pyrophosphatase (non-canonical NTP hydrolase)
MMETKQCDICNGTGWDLSLYRPPVLCKCGAKPEAGYTTILEQYQQESRKTYKDLGVDSSLTYPVLGMLNEAGEFAGKFKKIFRDKGGVIDEATRLALRDELGDVLWYLTQICTNLGYTLDELAAANLEKVLSRLERNQIHGDGDNR